MPAAKHYPLCSDVREEDQDPRPTRYNHVSLLIDSSFSALAIAKRFGHETTDITFRYAHLLPNVQENMAETLNNMKGGAF